MSVYRPVLISIWQATCVWACSLAWKLPWICPSHHRRLTEPGGYALHCLILASEMGPVLDLAQPGRRAKRQDTRSRLGDGQIRKKEKEKKEAEEQEAKSAPAVCRRRRRGQEAGIGAWQALVLQTRTVGALAGPGKEA